MVVKLEETDGVVGVVIGLIVVVIDEVVVSDTSIVEPIMLYH